MVKAENLGKRFGAKWVFRRLEFCVSTGECLLVTGSNGSGKSTLLRLIAGLEPASEGSVHTETSIGYSSPELRLYPHLTGVEHVELAAALRGIRSDPGILEAVGLNEAAAKTIDAYSTGMSVRLKLALAIQANPKLLVLDEPGAGLDEEGRQAVSDIVEAQRRRGAVVLATNDPLERRFGDLELQLG